jgi:hypothetical protein
LIGEAAKNQWYRNSKNTIFGMSKLRHPWDINNIICLATVKVNYRKSSALFWNKLILK